MMLCYGQILQRSQQEFFNLCKLETADLRPFLPDTGHLLLRVRVDPQRSTAAEYSQHEMVNTRTHTQCTHCRLGDGEAKQQPTNPSRSTLGT